jgi:hypothetical protein
MRPGVLVMGLRVRSLRWRRGSLACQPKLAAGERRLASPAGFEPAFWP